MGIHRCVPFLDRHCRRQFGHLRMGTWVSAEAVYRTCRWLSDLSPLCRMPKPDGRRASPFEKSFSLGWSPVKWLSGTSIQNPKWKMV
jgi:hypothetical protein